MENKKKKSIWKAKSPGLLIKAKIVVSLVEANIDVYRKLSDSEVKERVAFFVDQIRDETISIADIVVDAFSMASESIFRQHKLFAHHVQIMGAYIIHTGDFAEMFTGEVKL